MIKTKAEVLDRFCRIATEVLHYKFRYDARADCICPNSEEPIEEFQFSEEVISYIEDSVRARLVIDGIME